MFTGLVTAVGELTERQADRTGSRVRIRCSTWASLELGESIAVNGACVTVSAVVDGGFLADLSAETVERTTLGRSALGSAVNLERALRVGDRLGGHWVTGHVDGTVRLMGREPSGESLKLEFELLPRLRPYIAPKGSVALDGVSLTVNAVAAESFQVMLIPHTRLNTTLSKAPSGTQFNLEVDVLARYVVHAMGCPTSNLVGSDVTTPRPSANADLLAALGRAGIL